MCATIQTYPSGSISVPQRSPQNMSITWPLSDVKAATAFYQKAFGFAKRGIMNGPDGKPVHSELTLRGSTIMLSPEMPQMGSRNANNAGASPTSLYVLTENADKTVAKAVKAGATLMAR